MFWSCGHNSRQFLKISQYWHYTLPLFACLQKKPSCFCIFVDRKCSHSVMTCLLSSHTESEIAPTPLNSTLSVQHYILSNVSALEAMQVLVWWSAILKVNCIYATVSCQWTQVYWTLPKRQQLYCQSSASADDIWKPLQESEIPSVAFPLGSLVTTDWQTKHL